MRFRDEIFLRLSSCFKKAASCYILTVFFVILFWGSLFNAHFKPCCGWIESFCTNRLLTPLLIVWWQISWKWLLTCKVYMIEICDGYHLEYERLAMPRWPFFTQSYYLTSVANNVNSLIHNISLSHDKRFRNLATWSFNNSMNNFSLLSDRMNWSFKGRCSIKLGKISTPFISWDVEVSVFEFDFFLRQTNYGWGQRLWTFSAQC